MNRHQLLGIAPKRRDEVPCPELEKDVLLRLQNLVELLDGDNADQVVDLMSCYQVQHARLSDVLASLNYPERGLPRGLILTRDNFEFTLSSTVELHLRAAGMFNFARRIDDSIAPPPFTKDVVQNALRLLGVEEWLSDLEHRSIETQMTSLAPLGRWRHD